MALHTQVNCGEMAVWYNGLTLVNCGEMAVWYNGLTLVNCGGMAVWYNVLTLVNCGGMVAWYNGAGDVPIDGLRDTGGDGDTLSSWPLGASTINSAVHVAWPAGFSAWKHVKYSII